MARYPKRQKVKRYRRSFYTREMRLKKGIGIQCCQRECILRDAEHRCQRTGSFLGAGKRAGARGQGH